MGQHAASYGESANAIFGVTSILLVSDRVRGTGHFKLVQGTLATCVGLDAALTNTLGGTLVHRFSFAAFVGLAGVAALPLMLLWTAMPETLRSHNSTSAQPTPAA